jgi:hypothetical protein
MIMRCRVLYRIIAAPGSFNGRRSVVTPLTNSVTLTDGDGDTATGIPRCSGHQRQPGSMTTGWRSFWQRSTDTGQYPGRVRIIVTAT